MVKKRLTLLFITSSHVKGTREEWSHVFLMFGGLYSLACIIFVTTGSAELQSWGKVKKKDENKDEKHQV